MQHMMMIIWVILAFSSVLASKENDRTEGFPQNVSNTKESTPLNTKRITPGPDKPKEVPSGYFLEPDEVETAWNPDLTPATEKYKDSTATFPYELYRISGIPPNQIVPYRITGQIVPYRITGQIVPYRITGRISIVSSNFTTSARSNNTSMENESQDNELPGLLDCLIIGFNSVLCLACLSLNGSIVAFYRNKINRIVPFLYTVNALSDIAIGTGIALQMFIFIPPISPDDDVAGYLSKASYIIVGVSIRVSTFVNLLLCIVRAINIVLPFYSVSKVRVACSIAICSMVWLGLAIWDVAWFTRNAMTASGIYIIKSLVLKPEMGFAALKTIFRDSLSNLGELLILFVPVFLVPVLILMASTAIQVN